ncbi:hypothetical protein LASUN_13210 [Lentilactobacillus sunkii]|uniref:Uncharacterized protein n=1 Tax=Lentilactobacillus sunkii TaxID=481719 RepID=A0A1E7XCL7_9LACO|nr:hypothetical protein LASUN_13210 [Lentilactobacillus sunkii]
MTNNRIVHTAMAKNQSGMDMDHMVLYSALSMATF